MVARFHFEDLTYRQLLQNELPVSQTEEITDHIEFCESCQSRLESISEEGVSWGEIRDLLSPEPAEAATDSTDHAPTSFLAPTAHPDSLGRFGRYEVMEILGRGGTGVVLKGHDPALGRYSAVKVLAPELATSAAARNRFAREARSAAAVVHEHVVPIQTVDEEGGLPYLVMPVVEGSSLEERVQERGPLDLREILRIGMQTAAGLAAAHAQGLVHRDVKPGNILLENGVERVMLTDFGLARAADDANMTQSGTIAGTPQYMSPEQARGEDIDSRSDLFSLGSVLYFMCAGRSPFRAETTMGILNRISNDAPREIRKINSDIPTWLQQIIECLLAKKPDDRYQSASEVADLLAAWLAHLQQPDTVPAPKQGRNSASLSITSQRSNWRPWAFVAGLLLLLASAGTLLVLELNQGVLTIESSVPDLPVRILKNNQVYKRLTVTRGDNSVRIAAGEYLVELDGSFDGFQLDQDRVAVLRGGQQVVRIVREEKPEALDEMKEGAISALAGAGMAEGAIAPLDSNQSTLDVDPVESLSAYEGFLWGSIRPLEESRSNYLKEITNLEQVLLEEEELSAAGQLDKAQQDRQASRIAEISDRIASLASQLATTEKQITLLQSKLARLGRSALGASSLDAQISAVEEDQVEISGKELGQLRPGSRVTVSRDAQQIAGIQITSSEEDRVLGRILWKDVEIRTGDEAQFVPDPRESNPLRLDRGEPIYNNRLRRFKFHLETIPVTDAAEIALEFWVRYRDRGNPPISGAWGDPRTNSLIVVAAPEADQAIRDTIAGWEGTRVGVDFDEDNSLEAQLKRLQQERRHVMSRVVESKLRIIEAKAAEPEESEVIAEYQKKLASDEGKLEILTEKLRVVSDSLEELQEQPGEMLQEGSFIN